MSRDFAFKKRSSEQTSSPKTTSTKKFFLWGTQIILIVIVFSVVLAVFSFLSEDRKASTIVEDVDRKKVEEVEEIEKVEEEIAIDIKELNENTSTPDKKDTDESINPLSNIRQKLGDLSADDKLQFYKLLQQPLDETVDTNPIIDNNIYRVKSALIRHNVNARSLKALLAFEGFRSVKITSVISNNQKWYRLVISPISSRSKMNSVRDFLGKHDLDSSFSIIK